MVGGYPDQTELWRNRGSGSSKQDLGMTGGGSGVASCSRTKMGGTSSTTNVIVLVGSSCGFQSYDRHDPAKREGEGQGGPTVYSGGEKGKVLEKGSTTNPRQLESSKEPAQDAGESINETLQEERFGCDITWDITSREGRMENMIPKQHRNNHGRKKKPKNKNTNPAQEKNRFHRRDPQKTIYKSKSHRSQQGAPPSEDDQSGWGKVVLSQSRKEARPHQR